MTHEPIITLHTDASLPGWIVREVGQPGKLVGTIRSSGCEYVYTLTVMDAITRRVERFWTTSMDDALETIRACRARS